MEKGMIINQAYEILKETYNEIYKLKDDAAEILRDKKYDFSEEYSYGGKFLNVIKDHLFIFKNTPEDEYKYCEIFGIVVLFDNDGWLKKISLKDEPEIWLLRFKVENYNEKIRYNYVQSIFSEAERVFFDDGVLMLDSNPYNYCFIEDDNDVEKKEKLERHEGKVVGTALTSIESKKHLQELIEKLF